ncbi:MAG: peptide chain release factor N(5)-glutamine methyltransferase [Pyrinomonadaceae bacterium]
MKSIAESLTRIESALAASGIAEARREAMSLLMLATQKDKTFIYGHPEHTLTPEEVANLNLLLARRAKREPLQYISGVQEFYGLDFDVTPDVLIPRPETEMVVEHAIEILGKSGGDSICDVGVGSGCIAISILHELLHVSAVGLDASAGALKVARRNADKHGVSSRLELRQSDVFSGLREWRYGLIVSNPPYVPVEDIAGLQPEVRDFEPHTALTDDSDGFSIIRRIVNESPQFLKSRGHLLLEIGFNQSEKVGEMFAGGQWLPPDLYPDLQGIPRLISAQLI